MTTTVIPRTKFQVYFLTPISVLISDPRTKLAAIMPELIELRNFLSWVEEEDSLYNIVRFFERTSPWHDRGLRDVIEDFTRVNYGQWNEVIAALDALEELFMYSGRSEYGWNRTKPGERVTENNVFLGDVHGLFTHPVRYWIKKKDEAKGAHPDFPNMNAYNLVFGQAQRIIRSHARPMIDLISKVETEMKK